MEAANYKIMLPELIHSLPGALPFFTGKLPI
jgi:hypothetical protein